MFMSLAQFGQAVDVVGRLGTLGKIHETPFLIRLVRTIYLIETVWLACFRLVNETFSEENRERFVGVELLDATVFYFSEPLQSMPVVTITDVARYHGTENLQFAICKLAYLVVPLSLHFVFFSGAFLNACEVLVWR